MRSRQLRGKPKKNPGGLEDVTHLKLEHLGIAKNIPVHGELTRLRAVLDQARQSLELHALLPDSAQSLLAALANAYAASFNAAVFAGRR